MIAVLVGVGLAAGLGVSGVFGVAVEEPAFKRVLHDGAFEIRDYPALTVAEVTVPGTQNEAISRGFRVLAGYIFGANHTRQTIAMTAPVAQAPVSETIAMTAPVAQTQAAGQWVVRFTMPHQYTLATLPRARRCAGPAAPDRPATLCRGAVFGFGAAGAGCRTDRNA